MLQRFPLGKETHYINRFPFWKEVGTLGATLTHGNFRTCRLEIRLQAGGMEWDLEGSLDVDGHAVFHSRLELALGHSLAGEAVDSGVDAPQDAHVADSAVGADDAIDDHGAGNILLHQLHRIGGIDFARRARLGEVSGGRSVSWKIAS